MIEGLPALFQYGAGLDSWQGWRVGMAGGDARPTTPAERDGFRFSVGRPKGLPFICAGGVGY